jgi:hypothetical protein
MINKKIIVYKKNVEGYKIIDILNVIILIDYRIYQNDKEPLGLHWLHEFFQLHYQLNGKYI